MEEKMEVHIEVFVNTYDDIKDIVKLASDIQKEHSCHCTLNVNTDECFKLIDGRA
nr:MAG TPA: hypothetical protein [Caudoviricetes sp.]